MLLRQVLEQVIQKNRQLLTITEANGDIAETERASTERDCEVEREEAGVEARLRMLCDRNRRKWRR